MAKKSLIAGEYIIEIADNGHVDVLRAFRNAKVTMEEIAKSKNFPVDEKWNTQDLGRHLVKEFGDGKTALFNDITINRFADGKIEIYQECKNVKEALRTIANQLGFHYEDTWNTQQFGSKLSDYLIEHKEEADMILQTKNARRKKENTEEALNISPAFGISETIIPINSNNMAKFNLTGSKTVAELKKEFNEAFGSRLKVYNGGSVADDNETLGNLGLKEDTTFECRSSRTAASFIEGFKELGLKVTIWTRDYNVKVLDGLTLKSTGEIKNMATKKDMEDKIAYQREEKENDADDAASSGKTYTLRIGGERGFKIGVYSCGYEGDELYERAMEVAENDDDDEKRELIDELNDDFDTHIASWFVQPLTDDYTTHVEVEDEEGNIIFEDDLEASQEAYSGDPRKWNLTNLPASLASAIKSAIDKYADKLAKCKSFDDWSEEEVLNDDLCSDLTSTIVSAPLKEAGLDTENLPLIAVDCPSTYTFCYEGQITIPEGEEFDAEKLHLIVSDYEDYCPECVDSVLPVIQYDNALYQLECGDWEEHYSDIRILDLGGYDDKVYISF